MASCTVRDSLIADGCFIGTSTIIEKSVVGMRTHIGKDVTLKYSVLMGADFYPTTDDHLYSFGDSAAVWGIGDGAYIDGAMLDKNVCIGRNARIVASEAPSSDCDFGEVLVRDGIPCVRKNARVPDGWRFPAK